MVEAKLTLQLRWPVAPVKGLSGTVTAERSLTAWSASSSDLDRHVDGVSEIEATAADEDVVVSQVGTVDDQWSAWLQVVDPEPLVRR